MTLESVLSECTVPRIATSQRYQVEWRGAAGQGAVTRYTSAEAFEAVSSFCRLLREADTTSAVLSVVRVDAERGTGRVILAHHVNQVDRRIRRSRAEATRSTRHDRREAA